MVTCKVMENRIVEDTHTHTYNTQENNNSPPPSTEANYTKDNLLNKEH